MSLLRMFNKILRTGLVTEKHLPASSSDAGTAPVDYRGEELRRRIREVLGGSLHIRHLDSGSCNGCDWEIAVLLSAASCADRRNFARYRSVTTTTSRPVRSDSYTASTSRIIERAYSPVLVSGLRSCIASLNSSYCNSNGCASVAR